MDQAKKLYELQKQAKEIKKKLKNIHVEADFEGVKVTINGEQTIVSVEIVDESLLSDKKKLEKNLAEAFNKGVKKSQEVAAENMKDIMGNLGLGQM